jgi:hypothetical protein
MEFNSPPLNIDGFPIGFQQIYNLSKFLCANDKFRIAVVVSKTPYLSAAIAAFGAKSNIQDPLQPGTCILVPSTKNNDDLSHAVIERLDSFGDQTFYYYKSRKSKTKTKKNQLERDDVGVIGKPASYIKSNAVVYPYANENDWLGRHDVNKSEFTQRESFVSIFPLVIGNKKKFDKWLNKKLGVRCFENKSLSVISGIKLNQSKYEDVKFISPLNGSRIDSPTIWIDKVPPSDFKGRGILFISPHISNFEEKMLHLGDLFQEQKYISSSLSDLPNCLGQNLAEKACYKISLLQKGNQ